MKRKSIHPIRREELEGIPTKALLGRLKRFQQCEESLEMSDLQEDSVLPPDIIQFKNTPGWRAAYDDLKLVLSKREHIPRIRDSQKLDQHKKPKYQNKPKC